MKKSRSLGPAHPSTLSSCCLVALLLDRLGRSDEALRIARAVAEALKKSPSLGPAHPSTLSSRYLVALLLDRLGRSDEALRIARAVFEAMKKSLSLGSAHPSKTLCSRRSNRAPRAH
jgi:DNA repair protein RadC